MRAPTLAALTLTLALAPLAALGDAADGILIEDAFAYVSGPAARSGAGYMRITNTTGHDDRLVAAASAAAARAELHAHELRDGVARMMLQAEGVPAPAGATVALAPGGLHVMLMGLTAPLAAGDSVELTLIFERAGAIPVALPVETAPRAPAPAGHDH